MFPASDGSRHEPRVTEPLGWGRPVILQPWARASKVPRQAKKPGCLMRSRFARLEGTAASHQTLPTTPCPNVAAVFRTVELQCEQASRGPGKC